MQAELAKASRESKSYVIDLSLDSDDEEENSASGSAGGSESRSGSANSDVQKLGSGKGKGKGKVVEKSHRSSTPNSESDVEITKVPSKRPSTTFNSKATSSSSQSVKRTILSPTPNSSSSTSSSTSNHWECSVCTYKNPSLLFLTCEVCAAERPPSQSLPQSKPSPPSFSTSRPDGWMCELCLTVTDHTFWTCMNCGKVKTSSAAY